MGRHIVEALLHAGHAVTLLNRGTSNPGLFEDVPRIVADRDGDLSALAGTRWDAVVDVAAYFPRQVRALLGVLGDGLGRYVYVSTVSVYGNPSPPEGGTEDAEVEAILDDAEHAAVTGENYGPLKAGCERVAAELVGDADRLAVLRLGLVVGPWDHTGRFSYWPARLADGGEVLAPGDGTTPAQVIDARDIAAFTATVLAEGVHGTFNVVAPAQPWSAWLDAIAAGVGPDGAELTWVDEAFLLAQGVEPWVDLPLCGCPRRRPACSRHPTDAPRPRGCGPAPSPTARATSWRGSARSSRRRAPAPRRASTASASAPSSRLGMLGAEVAQVGPSRRRAVPARKPSSAREGSARVRRRTRGSLAAAPHEEGIVLIEGQLVLLSLQRDGKPARRRRQAAADRVAPGLP